MLILPAPVAGKAEVPAATSATVGATGKC